MAEAEAVRDGGVKLISAANNWLRAGSVSLVLSVGSDLESISNFFHFFVRSQCHHQKYSQGLLF